MDAAAIAAGAFERRIVHRLAAAHREFVGRAQRDVARGVLVEQRVVEQQPGLRDRRAVRHERDLAETAGARVGVDELLQDGLAALGGHIRHAAGLECQAEIFDHRAAVAERLR